MGEETEAGDPMGSPMEVDEVQSVHSRPNAAAMLLARIIHEPLLRLGLFAQNFVEAARFFLGGSTDPRR